MNAREAIRRRGGRIAPLHALSRFLYTREEAAAAFGMSLSHFQRHVQPHLKCVYSGQLRLYRPQELERWAEQEACEGPRAEASRR